MCPSLGAHTDSARENTPNYSVPPLTPPCPHKTCLCEQEFFCTSCGPHTRALPCRDQCIGFARENELHHSQTQYIQSELCCPGTRPTSSPVSSHSASPTRLEGTERRTSHPGDCSAKHQKTHLTAVPRGCQLPDSACGVLVSPRDGRTRR